MYKLVPPSYRFFISNLALIGPAVSEMKIFQYYGDINVYCPGVGSGQPLGSIFFFRILSLMLYAKFQNHRPSGSEEDF